MNGTAKETIKGIEKETAKETAKETVNEAMNLLETIKITDGHFLNLNAHLERMTRSAKELFGKTLSFELNDSAIPADMQTGTVKCRIVYSHRVDDISYSLYTPRKINSLRMVCCDDIDYRYKYADRSMFDNLLKYKDGCDEILIIKNGFVTDTSYSNVAFSDGKSFFIPKTKLLDGCKRRFLIENGLAEEICISSEDIKRFQTVHLINAMLDIGDITLNTDSVFSFSGNKTS